MVYSQKVPIAVWEDHGGGFTARVLGVDDGTAYATTAAEAVEQLRRLMRWREAQEDGWRLGDMDDLQLSSVEIKIRPEYPSETGAFTCDDQLRLRVPYVQAQTDSQTLICVLPTLESWFFCHVGDQVDALVSEQALRQLQGMTPAQLARFRPPKQITLTSVMVRRRQRSPAAQPPELPALRMVAEPLGDRIWRRRVPRAWERDVEINDLVARLTSTRSSLLLVGEGGAGKTTLLAEAVRRVERMPDEEEDADEASGIDDVTGRSERPTPRSPRYWGTGGARLIAGMQYLGQWEERCERVIDDLAEIGGVLCISNLLELLRYGGSTPNESVAAFMRPYVERGELRLVAEATPSEVTACRRLLPGLIELFQRVPVNPLSAESSQRALRQMVKSWSLNAKVAIDDDVVPTADRLYRRFQPYLSQPGPAARLLRGLVDKAEAERLERVDRPQVLEHFKRETGLSERLLVDEQALPFTEVRDALRAQVIGQPAGCDAAARVVTAFKTGLNDPRRPLGVLLFCGPTGVGKTELAKSLSRYLFGSGVGADSRLVRLDMSEYGGFGAAHRLLNQASGEPAAWLERVRSTPFVVLLFDEIEKAAPEVFDVLLGALDEGRLTDRYGRTTTLRSAVIILTSNLGVEQSSPVGFDAERPGGFERAVSQFFRPEFFNRLDAVVTFQPLGPSTIREITAKELGALAHREGLAKHELRLAWSDAVVELLAREGFAPRYGARPLQRVVEQRVVAPLARWLVDRASTGAPVRGVGVRLDVDAAGRISVREI